MSSHDQDIIERMCNYLQKNYYYVIINRILFIIIIFFYRIIQREEIYFLHWWTLFALRPLSGGLCLANRLSGSKPIWYTCPWTLNRGDPPIRREREKRDRGSRQRGTRARFATWPTMPASSRKCQKVWGCTKPTAAFIPFFSFYLSLGFSIGRNLVSRRCTRLRFHVNSITLHILFEFFYRFFYWEFFF